MKTIQKMKTILKLDIDFIPPKDWIKDFIITRTAMLEGMGYSVEEVIYRKSGSGKGLHFWIYITPFVNEDMEILKLQWLLNDDETRCKINLKRLTTKNTILDWNIFYDKILYKKPMPENCQRCALLKYMKESKCGN
ncbi:MAG: hypothetical protein ACP5D2_02455 [Candidatus Nanoarchaeia archaeon]